MRSLLILAAVFFAQASFAGLDGTWKGHGEQLVNTTGQRVACTPIVLRVAQTPSALVVESTEMTCGTEVSSARKLEFSLSGESVLLRGQVVGTLQSSGLLNLTLPVPGTDLLAKIAVQSLGANTLQYVREVHKAGKLLSTTTLVLSRQ